MTYFADLDDYDPAEGYSIWPEDDKDGDQEPEMCSACNGSGEGQYDGSVCQTCKGCDEV